MRGEVVSFVEPTEKSKRAGKSIVMVWNGSKAVKVTLPTQFLAKVKEGQLFPYKITRDPKTKLYVSKGRRGL
jgi:hypothetical protein